MEPVRPRDRSPRDPPVPEGHGADRADSWRDRVGSRRWRVGAGFVFSRFGGWL